MFNNKNFLIKLITTILIIVGGISFYNALTTTDKNNVSAANSRAVPEYMPVPEGIVPMGGVLTNKVGTSPVYDNETNVLEITRNTGQVGGIWSKKKLNFNKDFVYSSYIYLGNKKNLAADGVTFTFQNDPRMASNPGSVLAGRGFALGVYGDGRAAPNVQKALSIEFDTYQNGGGGAQIDKNISANNDMGHIAIGIPSIDDNRASFKHINVQYPTDYLSNGKWRTFSVTWNATSKTMTYGISGLPNKTYNFDPAKIFGANEAYWGFTGSTGENSAVNAVAISEIPQKGSQTLTITDERTGEVIKDLGNVQHGDKLKYELNSKYIDGPEDWSNVFVKLSLPKGITYTPKTIISDGKTVGDGGGNVSGQLLNVSIGNLKTDQVNKLSFEATVDKDAVEETTLPNRGLANNSDFGVQSNLVNLLIKKSESAKLTIRQSIDTIKDNNSTKMIELGNFSAPDNVYYRLMKISSEANNSNPINHFVIDNFVGEHLNALPGEVEPLEFSEASYSFDGATWKSSDALTVAVKTAILNKKLDVNTKDFEKELALSPGHTMTIAVGYKLKAPLLSNVDFKASLATPDNQSTIQPEVKSDIDGVNVVAPDFNKVRLTAGKSNLNIHYIQKSTNIEVSKTETSSLPMGEKYTTDAKIISGWSNIGDSGNTFGVMGNNTVDVYYYYEQPSLSLNHWPSEIEFGERSFVSGADTYYAYPDVESGKVKAKSVQVESHNLETGWQLRLQQDEQFKTGDNIELSGAELTFDNANVTADKNEEGNMKPSSFLSKIVLKPGPQYGQVVMSAIKNTGVGTWNYNFGSGDDIRKSISLSIPKETQRDSARYTSKLTWTLEGVPPNK